MQIFSPNQLTDRRENMRTTSAFISEQNKTSITGPEDRGVAPVIVPLITVPFFSSISTVSPLSFIKNLRQPSPGVGRALVVASIFRKSVVQRDTLLEANTYREHLSKFGKSQGNHLTSFMVQ
jgi:hypothetical protein